MIVPCRRRSARPQCADAPNISNELPNLGVYDLAAERWHPIRTPFDNRRKNLLRGASVNPFVVHQRGTHSAAAMGVAAHAIEGREELLTLADGVGVLVKAVLRDRRLSSATSGMQIAQRIWWALFRRGGSLEVALLPLAAHEGKSETQTENQESRNAGIQESAVSSLSCFPAFLIHFAVATCFGGSGTRGTLYCSRIASTSSRFCWSTALI